jgi:hypothetical protein
LGRSSPAPPPQEIQKEVFFSELEDLRLEAFFDERLAMVAGLTPPDDYRDDHAAYLESLRERQLIMPKIVAALESGDFPSLHLALATLMEEGNLIVTKTSLTFCRALSGATPDVEFRERLCDAGEAAPGGDYAQAIIDITRRYVSGFGPRASFPPGMSADDTMQALLYVQPAIEELFRELIDELDTPEPPEDLVEGHEVFGAFLAGLLETALLIDAAVEARDGDQVLVEFQRSQDVAETALETMPENYKPLVSLVFPEFEDE